MSHLGRPKGAHVRALRAARNHAVPLIGATGLAFGAALMVAPGSSFVIIPSGRVILNTEHFRARRLLGEVKVRACQGLDNPTGGTTVFAAGRPLVLAMFVVAARGLASPGFRHFHLAAIKQETAQITRNGAQSIEHLFALRTELPQLRLRVNEYLAAATARRRWPWGAVQPTWAPRRPAGRTAVAAGWVAEEQELRCQNRRRKKR